MSSALKHLKHTIKKFPEKCMLKGPIAVSIYGQLVKESQAVSTRQHHYRKKKHRHAKRARVIFLVIGVFVELFTVMVQIGRAHV